MDTHEKKTFLKRELDSALLEIASHIRSKAGISDSLEFYEGFLMGLDKISGSGGFSIDDYLLYSIAGTISGSATVINQYAFRNMPHIINAYFPECTTIESNAFYSCSGLETIEAPNVSFIGAWAFYRCSNLKAAVFPKCQELISYTFDTCSSLSIASFSECKIIGAEAFEYCRNLKTIYFPVVSIINYYAFAHCEKLTEAVFPNVYSLGNSAFEGCGQLNSIYFPLVSKVPIFGAVAASIIDGFPLALSIETSAFERSPNLHTISFPAASRIATYAFFYCSSLRSAYFLGSSVPTLVNSNAFQLTPLASGYGHIYVRPSLYEAFRSANNWSYYASVITSYYGD